MKESPPSEQGDYAGGDISTSEGPGCNGLSSSLSLVWLQAGLSVGGRLDHLGG